MTSHSDFIKMLKSYRERAKLCDFPYRNSHRCDSYLYFLLKLIIKIEVEMVDSIKAN